MSASLVPNSTVTGTGQPVTPTPPVYESGDIAWLLASSALVCLMTPGLGFFYSGMAKSKNALHILILCISSLVIVSIQWFLFGYSLAFAKSSNPIIGNFDHLALNNVLDQPSMANPKIPQILFFLFQSKFAAITPALILGAGADRARFLPTILFMLLWTTFVYDFLAYWTWNPSGWIFKMGALDYAGGTPVHISSGAAALAYAVILGPRENHKVESKPHNMSNVIMGTALIWFGWFGFNGGSALAANTRAIMSCVVTHLAACMGGITWVFLDYRFDKKYSPVGFCAGLIAGLVAITPASGFVSPASSLAFGFFGALCCNVAMSLKHILRFDDALDVVAIHGVGGIVGNLLTGIFAQKWVAALDGQEIQGGFLDNHWQQLGYQAIDTVAAFGWSFVVTLIILFIMNKIPGLNLRVKIEKERTGLDEAEHGIRAFEEDYFVDFYGKVKHILPPLSHLHQPNANGGSNGNPATNTGDNVTHM